MAAVALAAALLTGFNAGPANAAAATSQMMNNHAGLCIGPANDALSNNAEIELRACSDSPEWTTPSSGSYQPIIDQISKKCLGVGAASTTNGATIVQYTCDSSNN